jgi:hypothetical protein
MTTQEKSDYIEYLNSLTYEEIHTELEDYIQQRDGNGEMAESVRLGIRGFEYSAAESDYENESSEAQVYIDVINEYVRERF